MVYNGIGRIITQKPIAQEADKNLDLTKQGKGIYLIRITEGDKCEQDGDGLVQFVLMLDLILDPINLIHFFSVECISTN